MLAEKQLATVQFSDDDTLREKVLVPYRKHTKYLKNATLYSEGDVEKSEFLTCQATFEIPESCYIDDTGHFNSVEFNICYNQIMYYTIAKAVKEQAAPYFMDWTMDQFWERQLPNVLITHFNSKFKKPMRSSRFYGQIRFVSSRTVRGTQYINTLIQFSDSNDGKCEGSVKLAITS